MYEKFWGQDFMVELDACVINRVSENVFHVIPSDGMTATQVLTFEPDGSILCDGRPAGGDGFLGLYDLQYLMVVGGSFEYDSNRFEFC